MSVYTNDDPHDWLTIMFCKPDTGPLAAAGCSSEAILGGCEQWERLCRALLPLHRGYECKCPEPGSFTLAFATILDALRFACAAQLVGVT